MQPVSDDETTDKRAGKPMDDDSTPPYPAPPEHLPPAEVRRIERVIGRQPGVAPFALAERYRAEGADPLVMIAQIALDVHDVKKPVEIATRVAYWVAGGIAGAIVFVAILVSHRAETDTAVEYRLRALEELRQRCERLIDRLEHPRPDFPVATHEPTNGPPP